MPLAGQRTGETLTGPHHLKEKLVARHSWQARVIARTIARSEDRWSLNAASGEVTYASVEADGRPLRRHVGVEESPGSEEQGAG